MKITFVYPDFFQYSDGSFFPEARMHLGICMMSAQLKAAGHEVSLIHCVRPWEREEFVSRVKEDSPDLLAFSATTMMYQKCKMYSEWTKESFPDLITLTGGVHAMLDPEDIVPGTPSMDYVVRGEGDHAIVEIMNTLRDGGDPLSLDNVWGRNTKGEVIRNKVRPLLEDLDALPFADRDLFDDALLCEDQKERGTVMACRGCPYNCTYCSNHIQRQQYENKKKYVRFRSVDNVIKELKSLKDRSSSLSFIRFDDDILTWDPEWFTDFCKRYKAEIDLPFVCNAFVNLLDEETIVMFAEAGCELMAMGIESGNPWLRGKILHRHMTNDDIVRVYQMCHDHGIKTVSTNMVAMPHETVDMILDTIKVNARAEPDTMQVSVFYPFPNTHMYDICKEEGYLTEDHRDSIFCDSILQLPGFNQPEMKAARENVHILTSVYNRAFKMPGPLSEMAVKSLDSLFLSDHMPRKMRMRILDHLLQREKNRGPLEFVKY